MAIMQSAMNTVTRNVIGNEKKRPDRVNDPKSISEYGIEKERAPALCTTGLRNRMRGAFSRGLKKNIPERDKKL